jgi:hypothetical protein
MTLTTERLSTGEGNLRELNLSELDSVSGGWEVSVAVFGFGTTATIGYTNGTLHSGGSGWGWSVDSYFNSGGGVAMGSFGNTEVWYEIY